MTFSQAWISVTTASMLTAVALAADPVCLDRADCRQELLWKGKDASGRSYRLVQATFEKASGIPWRNVDDDSLLNQSPAQILLLAGEGSEEIATVALLCNDGYGASRVGEDSILVAGNELTLSRNGGSSDRWGESYTLSLPTLALVATTHSGYWAASVGEWETDVMWDHRTLAGTVSTTVSAGAAGEPESDEGLTARATLVPAIAAPQDYDPARHGLGSCAAVVDASGDRGHVIHGPTSSAEDTTFRALLVKAAGSKGGALIVEVTDDVWVDRARNPLHEDHLELWMSPVPASRYDGEEGYRAADAAIVQWSIRLTDGATALLYGKPDGAAGRPLKGEAFPLDGNRRRVRIELPPPAHDYDPYQLTIVYSDSDDGKRQERLIATSELRRGRSYTLGTTHTAECNLGPDGLANAHPAGMPWKPEVLGP